ncbi:mitochondrial sorting assembly machinery 50 kDa subunit (Sam50) [Andalucia godoyi]|uniref:Mitochondrial sorting assembly machinery 50 kDa subunit (Sam50) n=1 Tax=Andalucia godoyi TaxID=505711 RepID=A0A8K0F4E8_ANDGO|nr:mitochondrial sorting assembly machinery 50 kDa subunit (Sam50) [Andalucia godoyi]|eukprot:ANDGO_01652.mRNA.1 mitochondrial sorting assembly machinery 50 kDa subunit (Sam50)
MERHAAVDPTIAPLFSSRGSDYDSGGGEVAEESARASRVVRAVAAHRRDKVVLSGIAVSGVSRTSGVILETLLAPLQKYSNAADAGGASEGGDAGRNSLETLVFDMVNVQNAFRQKSLFSAVDVLVAPSSGLKTAAAVVVPGTMEAAVSVQVKEAAPSRLKVETSVSGRGERAVSVSAGTHNLLGQGERMLLDGSMGQYKSNQFSLSFANDPDAARSGLLTLPWKVAIGHGTIHSPFVSSAKNSFVQRDLSASVGIDPFGGVFSARRSYKLAEKAAKGKLLPSASLLARASEFLLDCTKHAYTVEVVRRDVSEVSADAPLALRQECGEYTKLSLLHSFMSDGRDDPVVPFSGFAVRTDCELGVPIAQHTHSREFSTPFAKTSVHSQSWLNIWPGVSLSLDASLGVVASLSTSSLSSPSSSPAASSASVYVPQANEFVSRVPLCERIALAHRVRGLALQEDVGATGLPGASLGAVLTAGAHFLLPGDICHSLRIRGHVFGQAVSLSAAPLSLGSSWKTAACEAARSSRLVGGVGFALPTPIGAIELNWSMPVASTLHPGDRSKEWHFAFGFNML